MSHFQAELVVAMVTPFKRDYTIDFEKAEQLAVHLADNGCDGILVNGTTGESPTLSFEEKIELLKAVKSAVSGRSVQIMSGAGSNNTLKSIEEARKVAAVGVDALLVVVPYYNKPSQRGMVAHFQQIAQAVETEVVIYNIPSRSVVLMNADTMATLHQSCPNIIGVKQSHPDMDAVSEITQKLPANTWTTWCGDDSLTLPMMACGASGCISVLGHLTGKLMREMIQSFKAQDVQKAQRLHQRQFQLAKDIFFLPNPTVIKTCLAQLGMMGPTLRPPMVEPDALEMQRIEQILAQYKQVYAVV